MTADRYDDIADRLAAIEEELRDLAYDRLAERARDPQGAEAQRLRDEERRLERARRAVARAIEALRPDAAHSSADSVLDSP